MNNRKTLLNILREYTGKSNNYILNNLDKIDLHEIFFTSSIEPIDYKDFKEFKAFADLQKVVNHDLY
jgi:hypothetical protein